MVRRPCDPRASRADLRAIWERFAQDDLPQDADRVPDIDLPNGGAERVRRVVHVHFPVRRQIAFGEVRLYGLNTLVEGTGADVAALRQREPIAAAGVEEEEGV